MLRWIDGFDNYGTTTGAVPDPSGIVGRKYPVCTDPTNMYIQAGRIGGYGLQFRSGYAAIAPPALTTDHTMVVGFAFRVGQLADYPLVQLWDSVAEGMSVKLTSSGELKVYNRFTLLATSTGVGISVNTWYYLEFKVFADSSTGTYEVRLGGISIPSLTGTGANTHPSTDAYYNHFQFFPNFGLGDGDDALIIDDLYCLDGTGSDNNDFLGNMAVTTIRPSAAGDSTEFTPSVGDNFSCMDEVVCNDDTDYVEDDTSGHLDLYNYGATGITGVVKGVQVNVDCKETDATSFSIKTVCKSGSTVDADAGQSVGSINYVTRRRILEQDPATSAAWLVAGVDAAQFGIEVA